MVKGVYVLLFKISNSISQLFQSNTNNVYTDLNWLGFMAYQPLQVI